jgi:hypothetical protein
MTGELEECHELDGMRECGGKRSVIDWDGDRYGACEKCGTVTVSIGEDYEDGDDVFAIQGPGAVGYTVAEQLSRERFSRHRIDPGDTSDIDPFTRTTRY